MGSLPAHPRSSAEDAQLQILSAGPLSKFLQIWLCKTLSTEQNGQADIDEQEQYSNS